MFHVTKDEYWLSADGSVPLDYGGPVAVNFEQFDLDWLDRPLFARFDQVAQRFPEKIAVDDGLTQLSYRELRRACLHLAHRIDSIVPEGRPVGVMLDHGALFPVAALACLAAWRPCGPIDRNYPA